MANKITSCDIRMYTMGTGDCFILFFKSDDGETRFKLMIDCGGYNISKKEMEPIAKNILIHTNSKLDALLITHEHQDHVLGFDRGKEIFINGIESERPNGEKIEGLKINELWLPWTERDNDNEVKAWKKAYGKKKMALAAVSNFLIKEINGTDSEEDSLSQEESLFNKIYDSGPNKERSLNTRRNISKTIEEFSKLNTDPERVGEDDYIGGLKGMEVAKKIPRIKEEPRWLETGKFIEGIEGLDNIRIYVLGPPTMWTDVKKEHGKEGETYKHNNELELVRGLSSLPFGEDDLESCPFENTHIEDLSRSKITSKQEYDEPINVYRRIDYDWLIGGAANLSLRLTRGINNLSAVLAIEFIDSGKVMLFPGDAEYGSWKSWHQIEWTQKAKDWDKKVKDRTKHLTTDLLNRTVFYKVAHHMSHNGTAREKGINLMIHDDLVAMATLDYDQISENWKNTMPNRGLLKKLLNQTKGRLIIPNPEPISEDLYFDKKRKRTLSKEIDSRLDNLGPAKKEEFLTTKCKRNKNEHYVQYTVDGKKPPKT